jgi:hypothetical protein
MIIMRVVVAVGSLGVGIILGNTVSMMWTPECKHVRSVSPPVDDPKCKCECGCASEREMVERVSAATCRFVGGGLCVAPMFESHMSENGDNITMVTQLTVDRLPVLLEGLRRWGGLASVVLYVPSGVFGDALPFFRAVEEARKREAVFGGVRIAVAVPGDVSRAYPVNALRNAAWERARTSHVFYVDADFIPSADARRVLHENLPRTGEAVIVPVWDAPISVLSTQMVRVPANKAVLLSQFGESRAIVRAENTKFRTGPSQSATDYARWVGVDNTSTYDVEYVPWYEPYAVVHRSAPRFAEEFEGYGNDKVSWWVHLDALGYRLRVAVVPFLVHVKVQVDRAPPVSAKWAYANSVSAWTSWLVFKGFMFGLQERLGYDLRLGPQNGYNPPDWSMPASLDVLANFSSMRCKVAMSARAGVSCSDVCASSNQTCRAEFYAVVNQCERMTRLFGCVGGCHGDGAFYKTVQQNRAIAPLVSVNGTCFQSTHFWISRPVWSCAHFEVGARRVCPCCG